MLLAFAAFLQSGELVSRAEDSPSDGLHPCDLSFTKQGTLTIIMHHFKHNNPSSGMSPHPCGNRAQSRRCCHNRSSGERNQGFSSLDPLITHISADVRLKDTCWFVTLHWSQVTHRKSQCLGCWKSTSSQKYIRLLALKL